MLSQKLLEVLARVEGRCANAEAAARERQDILTKPQGALGRLEEISIALAGMTGKVGYVPRRKAVFALAGDHGVVDEGVSLFPQAVTVQMVANFVHGGAGLNVLARHCGVEVVVADFGVAGDLSGLAGIEHCRVAPGTANIAKGPAMSRDLACRAVEAGMALVEARPDLEMSATGEMGIGNTTPATAIACALLGREPEDLAGPGTGLPPARVLEKAGVIRRALEVNRPDPEDPWDVLRKVGGYEIAGLVGVVLASAARRIPCVIDGFISTAAALVAVRACPNAQGYLIAGHRSADRGHDAMLTALGLRPILDLDLRLGEGTGAVLAMSIVEAAGKILAEMSTFAEAGVSEAE